MDGHQGVPFAPLLHQPASPACRTIAHLCTHVLEPPLSEASDLRAPDPSLAPELTRRDGSCARRMQDMALASTASSTTRCSTSWPTTYNMGKLAGIIGGMRRSTGRSSERGGPVDLHTSRGARDALQTGLVTQCVRRVRVRGATIPLDYHAGHDEGACGGQRRLGRRLGGSSPAGCRGSLAAPAAARQERSAAARRPRRPP